MPKQITEKEEAKTQSLYTCANVKYDVIYLIGCFENA